MPQFFFEPMKIADVVLIKARRHEDQRGDLMETYERDAFHAAGIDADFVQDNQSLSLRRGTVRGLHYQVEPFAQAKLVRVPYGAIFDVAVDVRPRSPTYGQWCGAELSASNGHLLFVPSGFAHGFCTLIDDTIVAYKLDAAYSPAHERGVVWNDPTIGIDWRIEAESAILSDRDRTLPEFAATAAGG